MKFTLTLKMLLFLCTQADTLCIDLSIYHDVASKFPCDQIHHLSKEKSLTLIICWSTFSFDYGTNSPVLVESVVWPITLSDLDFTTWSNPRLFAWLNPGVDLFLVKVVYTQAYNEKKNQNYKHVFDISHNFCVCVCLCEGLAWCLLHIMSSLYGEMLILPSGNSF